MKIYALRDGDCLRYVGKTKHSLADRLSGHLSSARRGENTYKAKWIRSLLKKGQLPKITLIEEATGDGSKEEIAWIKYFKDHGVSLVNGTEGGEGAVFTESVRKKISKIVTKSWDRDPERRKKMSEWSRKRIVTEGTREKIRQSRIGKSPSLQTLKKLRARTHDDVWRSNHSVMLKGRKWTKEQREAHEKVPHTHSPETIKKMKRARELYWRNRNIRSNEV